MKKAIFPGIVALLTLAMVFGCDFVVPANSTNDEIPSVQYSADGKTITLRLDGGGTGEATRALSGDLAKISYDFFEVVFYADATNVARASWEKGQAASVRNVPRGGANGIDYGDVDPSAVGPGATPATDPDIGAAILFVGRKADKTLLAIGSLTNVDGAATATTVVTAASRFVTFTVTALETTIGAPLAATSTFLTNADDATTPGVVSVANTVVKKASLKVSKDDIRQFPLFWLPMNEASILAEYQFANIVTFIDGIMLESAPRLEFNIPRIPIGGGNYMEIGEPWALKTSATITNNTTPGNVLEHPIEFDLATDNTTPPKVDEGVCSFVFSIPVYAIVDSVNHPGVPDYITWYIKPGFGTGFYNLDDGIDGTGGSILLAVGNEFELDSMEIFVTGDIIYP